MKAKEVFIILLSTGIIMAISAWLMAPNSDIGAVLGFAGGFPLSFIAFYAPWPSKSRQHRVSHSAGTTASSQADVDAALAAATTLMAASIVSTTIHS